MAKALATFGRTRHGGFYHFVFVSPRAVAPLIRQISGGIVIGLTATVFVISFASIVYTGPLSPSLNRGIGLALLGGGVMAGLGAMLFSFRGTIMHSQDVTAIMLGGGAASIAAAGPALAQDALFATVIALIVLSAVLAGIACVLFGRLRLGYVARYVPYPVLGGFLTATGYLLMMGGIGVALDRSVSVWTLGVLFAPGAPALWVPWLFGGIAMVWVARTRSSDLALPLCTAVSLGLFYSMLALTGTPLADASGAGWLLGPFPSSGFLTDLGPSLIEQVEWRLVAQQTPVMIAIVFITALGALLNMNGINHILGLKDDLNGDLRASGYCNIAAAGCGGLVGYPLIGESVLGARLGLRGSVAGICVAIMSLIAAIYGAGLLQYLPRGLFGMLLVYLGVDLLWTWLWIERKQLQAREFAIVLIILAVAAAIGFLEALAVGVFVSMTLFIVSYAQNDFVRLQTTLANHRSMVERSDSAQMHLSRVGQSVVVLELTGFLFFGTATRLRDRILAVFDLADDPPSALVLDFRRVQDLDASAAVSLDRTFADLQRRGTDIRVCALTDEAKARLHCVGPLRIPVHGSLDEALQALEGEVLRDLDPDLSERESFLGRLRQAHPEVDFHDLFRAVEFAAGDYLIREGSPSNEIFVLVSGEACAVVGTGPEAQVIARFLPGALIGEMAYYGGNARSASVVTERGARVLQIDARQLGADSQLPPAVVSTIHRLAAGLLSQRLARNTRLLRDAEV